MNNLTVRNEDDFTSQPVAVGPVKIRFPDKGALYYTSSLVFTLFLIWMAPKMWPLIILSIALFMMLGPFAPRVCEATSAGLVVQARSILCRYPLMRLRWNQLDHYYWKQDARGWRLVLKVCRHRPGVVDNTFTWQFPRMTEDEQQRLDAVLRAHCNSEPVT